MRTSIERVLLIAGLLLPLSGCGETGALAPAAAEESETAEALSALGGATCWDNVDCTGKVIAIGISLKACRKNEEASSWRGTGGKCYTF
jgi:hypothetical protein